MAYLPLHNFKYDSGPRRIQSGPDHEGYVVVSSGVRSLGADNGIVVAGTPLSGVYGSGQQWGYDANWRYVPGAQYTDTDNNYYDTSLTLGPYSNTNLTSPITIAGVKASSSLIPGLTFANTTYKQNVYYGGRDLSDQYYSPFNTPEDNSDTEGYTGGGVTHGVYDSPLLINIFGNQGTSNRSEWNYNQPVYCNTFTETIRSTQPGLMSTPIRSVYRSGSSSYGINYGGSVFGGGFESPVDDIDIGYEPEIGTGLGGDTPTPFDTLTVDNPIPGSTVIWYGCNNAVVGTGPTYKPTIADTGCGVYPIVTKDGISYPGNPVTIYRPSVIYTTYCRNVKVVFQGTWRGYQIGYDKFPFPSSCSDTPNVTNYFSDPPQYIGSCLNFCSMQFGIAEPLSRNATFPEGGPKKVGPLACGRTSPCGRFERGMSGYYQWWLPNGTPAYNVFGFDSFFGVGGGIGGVWGGTCPVAYYSLYYVYDMEFLDLLDYDTEQSLIYGVDYFVDPGYVYLPPNNPPRYNGVPTPA